MSGALVLVATPIGNLGDVSQRAREALASADLIACEDSRHSGRLVKHLGVSDPTYIVVNEHTERDATARIVDAVSSGRTVALITDAGTPAISDPGAVVVRAVIDAGLTVTAVPGPAALVMALVLSGLPTTRFVFEGFLPRSGGDRERRLADIAVEERTVVVYESPRRIERTLSDLAVACGPGRRVAVTRELTKLHEEVLRGQAAEIAAQLGSRPSVKGEITLLVGPPEGEEDISEADLETAITEALAAMPASKAASEVAKRFNLGRSDIYQRILARRQGDGE